MHLNDLAIAGGAEAHSVVFQAELVAKCVEPRANRVAHLGVGVVEQALHRSPKQSSTRPQNVRRDGESDQRIERASILSP